MLVAEAISRIRTALRARSTPVKAKYRRGNGRKRIMSLPRSWSISRWPDVKAPDPSIMLHSARVKDQPAEVSLEDRRELARLLELKVSQVPKAGLLIAPARFIEFVVRAEHGCSVAEAKRCGHEVPA